MPLKGRKFISEFLLPHLNNKKFGSRLKWLNMEKAMFQLQWNHKSAADWKEKDAEVFIAWDKLKGHYRPNEKEYYTKSKQRFRAVLYKLVQDRLITEICTEDKSTKIFCIGKREKWEHESIMSFNFHSSSSYVIENPVESVIEDHKYSQNELSVSENDDDDMLSLYPPQSVPFHSLNKYTSQEIEPDSTIVEKSFDNYEFVTSAQPTLHVECLIISKDSLKNESLNQENFSLHQNIDENSSTFPEAALNNTTSELSNFLDEYSNCIHKYL